LDENIEDILIIEET
jgi:hypothetical protein